MDIGTKGTLRFSDGSTAKVVIVDKKTYPSTGMPTDYFLSYQEGETNQKLKHDVFKDKFPLPEALLNQVFTPENQQMEEEENNENNKKSNHNLDDIMKSLGVDKSTAKVSGTDELSVAYENCDIIYKTEHKVKGLPIFVGVEKKVNTFYIGFGDEIPFTLDKEEALYMITALGSLVANGIKDNFGMSESDVQKEAEKMAKKDIRFGKGSGKLSKPAGGGSSSKSSDTKSKIESEEEVKSEHMEKIQGELEEMKNVTEQMEEYTKNMSPEEKEQYVKELNKKQEELVAKKAREFERELLGSIEEEESVTYNYDYFKKVHEQQGQAALKEELAKLPKEERQGIITKIIEEAKLKKQQTPKTDEKAIKED